MFFDVGKVLNLNRARKAKARRDKADQADRNRVRHGRTKADKQAAQREREVHERTVDGARRQRPDATEDDASETPTDHE